MKAKILLLALIALLFTGMAAASTCDGNQAAVPEVKFGAVTYQSACANYKWEYTGTKGPYNATVGNIVVHATGVETLSDMNLSSAARSFSICTLGPGDSETFFIRIYGSDGNCSTDFNYALNTGTPLQAGTYLAYWALYGLASVVVLVIVTMVAVLIISRFGIKIVK